jgi:hypothetical protein
MSEARIGGHACDANHHERGAAASLGAAGWLSLAAAPAFAVMALLTAARGGGPADILCSAAPLSGMVPMYVLMSIFHASPWLKLISGGPKRSTGQGRER